MAVTKLKIGLILDTSLDSTDGVQQYVVELGRWLGKQGHEVHYLVGETHRTDLARVHSLASNVNVRFNGNRTTVPLYVKRRALKRFMAKHQFDVLHVQMPHHPLLAQPIILAAGPCTAVVSTFHILPYGRLAQAGNRLLALWLRPSLKRLDATMAVSDVAAAFCRRSFGLDAVTVPNMFDFNRFHTAKPLKNYRDRTVNILFLGRLVERKGCRILLEAVTLLENGADLPAYRVIICGRGKLESKLKRFINRNGISDKIEFVGYVTEADKPRYYATADIAIFPSRSGESFGIVLLEAMASGRAAVLAGDNPGYRSVMTERSDLLFDPYDAAHLASIIKSLLTDEAARHEAAESGEHFARQFDRDIVGRQILTVYKQALLKRRRQ